MTSLELVVFDTDPMNDADLDTKHKHGPSFGDQMEDQASERMFIEGFQWQIFDFPNRAIVDF